MRLTSMALLGSLVGNCLTEAALKLDSDDHFCRRRWDCLLAPTPRRASYLAGNSSRHAGISLHGLSVFRAKSKCNSFSVHNRRNTIVCIATRPDPVAEDEAEAEGLAEGEAAEERKAGDCNAQPATARLSPTWRRAGNLASRWREIAGENNWEGLLTPLDPDLKREILRCGDFIWPGYDAMDDIPESRYRGSALYHPSKLLDKVKLHGTGYQVTRYLYMLSDVTWVDRFAPYFQLPVSGEDGELWAKDSNWVGLVAVATDEEAQRLGRRDIIVSFRGTHTAKEWVMNVYDWLLPAQKADASAPWPDVVKVEAGFWEMFTGKSEDTVYNKLSAAEQVREEVIRLINKYQGEELSISVTGHSLGAALAVLCGYDVAYNGANRLPAAEPSEAATGGNTVTGKVIKELVQTVKTIVPGLTADKKRIPKGFLSGTVPITVYTFGCPRVGNDDFRDTIHALGVKVLRVEGEGDIVTRFPGVFFNEWILNGADTWLGLFFDSLPWTYIHVGVALKVNYKDSPFLKAKTKFMDVHDLQVNLHLVDGLGEPPSLERFNRNYDENRRDFALVNKYIGLLDPKYRIPEGWFQLENKGLVLNLETGRWEVPDRDSIDEPVNCVGPIDT